MGLHARLSPSSAEQWVNCPGSIKASLGVQRGSSVYAEEGTRAHTLGEYKAAARFSRAVGRAPEPDDAEMDEHTDGYVDEIGKIVAAHPGGAILFEQRMDTGVPGCWGTADCVYITETDIFVIDLKYGRGESVSPVRNKQLMLYGLGALNTFDTLGPFERVHLCIYQPRLVEGMQIWTTRPEVLTFWRDSIMPVAKAALEGSDVFAPSPKACRWCPVAGTCKPLQQSMVKDLLDDEPVTSMSNDEISNVLGRMESIRRWLDAVEGAAQAIAERGETIPGYKLIRSGKRRFFPDPAAAGEAAIAAGAPYDAVWNVTTKLVSQADLRRALGGAKAFNEVLKPLLSQTPGKLSLVPEDHPSEAENPVADLLD